MKPFASLLCAGLLTSVPAFALNPGQFNEVQNVQAASVSPSNLSGQDGVSQGVGGENDGLTATGSEVPPGEFYPTFISGDLQTYQSIFMTAGNYVDSVNFYSALFSDGGWWGTSGTSGVDGNGNLIGSVLTPPTLQVQYTNGGAWTSLTDGTDYTENYKSALTGQPVGTASGLSEYGIGFFGPYSAPTSVESTFTLTTPLTGITGVRLVGTGGGSNSYISGYEMEVIATPEPSTYAMLFGGVVMLVVIARLRKNLPA